MKTQTAKRGLGPLLCPDARVLILGSLPGDESIRLQQYYAHPRNQFWRMLEAVYGAPELQNYEAKRAFLINHRIAVWDVLKCADRAGSLDTAIRNGVPNDLMDLVTTHSEIAAIACNGQKAHALLARHFGRAVKSLPRTIIVCCLPSTSPAATQKLTAKITQWRACLIHQGR